MDPIVRKKAYEVPSIEDHGPVNDLTAAGIFRSKCGSALHNKANYSSSRRPVRRRKWNNWKNYLSRIF